MSMVNDDIGVFFHSFRHNQNGETLGFGTPIVLGSEIGVVTSIGLKTFAAFIDGKTRVKWRLATEFHSTPSFDVNLRQWMYGSQLIAVTNFPAAQVGPCFLAPRMDLSTRFRTIDIRLFSTRLIHFAGVQNYAISDHLSRLSCPDMPIIFGDKELNQISSQIVQQGDFIPISSVDDRDYAGMLHVVEVLSDEKISADLYTINNNATDIDTGRLLCTRIFSDFFHSRVVINQKVGAVV